MALDPELVALLCCPREGCSAPLLYFADGEAMPGFGPGFLLCPASRLKFPIDPLDIPVLLLDEAVEIGEAEAAELVEFAG
jgi:uncharacterized protein YbaR (Trm112 family)